MLFFYENKTGFTECLHITDRCMTFTAKYTRRDRAVISGDIIAYTSLSDADKYKIENSIDQLFQELASRFESYLSSYQFILMQVQI